MVAIAFTDSGNGSGGSMAITGTGGVSCAVHVSQFHGSNARRPFVVRATRIGDGVSTVAIPNGCYIAFALTSTGEASEPISFRVTDGTDALYYRFLEAVREFVLSLELPGVTTDPEAHVIAKIGARLLEVVSNAKDECVYYIPTQESFRYMDNAYVSVAMPVNVVIIRRSASKLKDGLRNIMIAREDLNLAFGVSPLPDLPEVHTVDVRPGPVTDLGQWSQAWDVSVIQLVGQSEQIDGIL